MTTSRRSARGKRSCGGVLASSASIAAVLALLTTMVILVAAGPQAVAGGPPYDGQQTSATGPAFFGPAPNPVPYCENPTYFDPFPENIAQVGRLDVNPAANEASVTTNGITMNFNVTAEGNPGGQYPGFFGDAPINVEPTDVISANDQPKGVEMASDDQAIVTLVDANGDPAPLFYSQWVFTDVDRANEGFFITPTYTDPGFNNQIAIFAGEVDFTFDGTTPTTAAFNDTDTEGQDSEDIEARVQVDVLGAVTGISMVRDTGSGQSGFAVGGGCEAAGAAKAVVSGPTWNGSSFDVTYELRLRNNLPSGASVGADVLAAQLAAAASTSTGSPTGIDLVDVQLEDDLSDPAFTDISVVSISNPGIAPQGQLPLNLAYNGLADTELLLDGAQVEASTNELIVLEVQYTPDLATGNWDDCTAGYDYLNQSVVSGSAANVAVQDESDNGINPDPGVGNGNDRVDDPTIVNFPCPPASLQIVKTVVPGPNGDCPAAEDGIVGLGIPLNVANAGTVTYCVSVLNPGASPVTSVVVTDPQNPNGDEAIGSIPGGSSSSFSYDVVVDQQTEETNTATAIGVGPEGALGPVSDPAIIAVGAPPQPILQIVKTVVAAGVDCPDFAGGTQGAGAPLGVTEGDTVTYCISVRNGGLSDLVDVTVSDAQAPASFDGVVGSLAPGQEVNLSYTLDVTAATDVVNVASVVGFDVLGTQANDTDDAVISISAQLDPVLEIVKTVVAGPAGDCPAFAAGVNGLGPSLPVLFGDIVTYCISVNNASGSTATNVVISDPMAPAGFDGDIGTLAVGDAPVTRSFDLVINELTPEINTASVNGEGPNGALPAESDQARIASSPLPDPVLEIVKTVIAGPDGVCPSFDEGVPGAGAVLDVIFGDTVTYCLSVRNSGLAAATNVIVSDPQAPASFDGDIGALGVAGEATVSFDVVVDATTPQLNTAQVDGAGPNGDLRPDTDQAVVGPRPPADPVLEIVKTVVAGLNSDCPSFDDGVVGLGSPLQVLFGDPVTYCISVANTSGSDATGVVVSDPIAPANFDGDIGDLAAGGDPVTRSFSLVVDAQTPDINTATATGTGPNGPLDPVTDQARITASPQPDPVLEIVKTVVVGPLGSCPSFENGQPGAGAALNVQTGDTVTYCISVTNSSGSDATDVLVSDPMAPANFDGAVGDLAVGDFASLSFDLVVDAATPTMNTARVDGAGPNGPVQPDTDQAVIGVRPPPPPVLDIVKTVVAGPAGECPAYADGVAGLGAALPALFGDTVTYCISVINTSGSTATDVVIVDPQAPAAFDGDVGDLVVGTPAVTRSFDLVVDAQTPDINIASATGEGPGGPLPMVDDAARIQPSPLPDPVLEIVKTVVAGSGADCPSFGDGTVGLGAALGVVAGDTVTYCISITNSSGSDATNVVISDPMAPASFDGAVGDLAVDEFATRSFELVIAIDTEPVNTATVGGDGPNGPVAQTTDLAVIAPRLPLDPALEIVKTVIAGPNGDCPAFDDGVGGLGASLPVLYGDTVTYCISVRNTSGSDAVNVEITDALAPDTFDGVVGDLAVEAEPVTRSFDLVIDAQTPDVNTATVGGDGPNGAIPPVSDQARIQSSPQPDPVLDVVKTVLLGADQTCPAYASGVVGLGPSLVALFGETVTYCISVTNSSGSDATNVAISDPMAPASFDGAIGDLAVGEFATRSFNLVIDALTEEVNTATVNGEGPNGSVTPSTDQARILSEAQPDPILQLVKTVVPGPQGECPSFADGVQGVGTLLPAVFGDSVTYCLTVTNIGAADAANVVVSDQQAPASFNGVIGALASNTEATRSFDLVIDAQTPTVNTARVDGEGPNGAVAPDTDQAGVDPSSAPLPRLEIVKTVVAGPNGNCPDFDNGIVGVGTPLATLFGNTVTYCISVANLSNVDANSVTLTDSQAPDDFDRIIGDLAARAEATRSYDLEVTSTTPTVNTALVAGRGPDGRAAPGDSDTAVISPSDVPEPILDIVKSVVGGPQGVCPAFEDGVEGAGAALDLIAGDTATYCLTVKNIGLGDATSVVISDAQAPTGFDGTVGDLTAGSEVTRTFDIEVTTSTPLVNTATVNGEGPNGPLPPDVDTARITVSPLLVPELAIVKTVVPGPDGECPIFDLGIPGIGPGLEVSLGNVVTYCVSVRNVGGATATDVVVFDPQAPGSITIGDLARDETADESYDVTITNSTVLTNVATVSGNGPGGPIGATDEAQVIPTEALIPSIALTNTVIAFDRSCNDAIETIDEYLVGLPNEDVRWCFVVTNTGNTALTEIVFNNGNLGLADVDVLADYGNGQPSLAPNTSIGFSLDDRFPAITNISKASVLATPSEADGTPIATLADVSATNDAVVESTAIELIKLVQTDAERGCADARPDAVVDVGQAVIWCFTVTNTGGVDVRVTEVNDSVLDVQIAIPEGEQVLEPGESVSVSFASVVRFTIANMADVVGTPVNDGGEPIEGAPRPKDDATTTVRTRSADLSIVKTNSNAGPLDRGDSLTYTLAITNDGPDPAANVVVVDTLPEGISYDELPAVDGWNCALAADDARELTCSKATELAVDATATLTYTATADADAARSTTFTNIATVTSSTDDPDLTNNTDDSSTRTPAPPVFVPPPALDPPPPPAPVAEPDEVLELVITGASSRALAAGSTVLLALGGLLFVAGRRRRADLFEPPHR